MTRRLEPLDRIRELGDASVPFGFDVHAMIYAEDAPRLERELHRKFLLKQINKTNPRKEFFRVTITELRELVEMLGLTCNWTLAADAAEYRESFAIDERIRGDPKAREQWLTHQMLVDPVTTRWRTRTASWKLKQARHEAVVLAPASKAEAETLFLQRSSASGGAHSHRGRAL